MNILELRSITKLVGFRQKFLPSVFGDNHFIGELLELAPKIALFQRNTALPVDAGIGWVVLDETAVTDHGR